jgi:Virulence-associated protein E
MPVCIVLSELAVKRHKLRIGQRLEKLGSFFIGTFNTTPGGELIQYLNSGDQRRWWPVLVDLIDIPGLERDRDQLFAEAMFEYEFGNPPTSFGCSVRD